MSGVIQVSFRRAFWLLQFGGLSRGALGGSEKATTVSVSDGFCDYREMNAGLR